MMKNKIQTTFCQLQKNSGFTWLVNDIELIYTIVPFKRELF